MQRIDNLTIEETSSPTVAEPFVSSLFITGPVEFLCYQVCEAFKKVEPWPQLFGDSVYPYPRDDLTIFEMPSMCVYRDGPGRRESWSHFYEGNLNIDIMLPLALKRELVHQYAETICSAVNLQLRGGGDFSEIIYGTTPGLKEFAKICEDEKFYKGSSLESSEALVISFKANFRIDLKYFDDYMVQDNRDTGLPFIRTLADVKSIFSSIRGVDDDLKKYTETNSINKL